MKTIDGYNVQDVFGASGFSVVDLRGYRPTHNEALEALESIRLGVRDQEALIDAIRDTDSKGGMRSLTTLTTNEKWMANWERQAA